jgi:hypothetical protein
VKFIKMIGLASVAAVAAMAFIGASSAMAGNTALCSSNEGGAETCAAGNQVATVHFVAKNGILLTGSSSSDVTCKEALLSGNVLGLAAPQQVHPTALTYSGCTTFFGLVSCTVTTTHFGLLDALKTGATVGTVVDLASGGAFTEVHVECANGSINCTYKGENLTGNAESASGANNGTVSYEKAAVTKVAGGSACPTTAELDATFISLTAVYLKS